MAGIPLANARALLLTPTEQAEFDKMNALGKKQMVDRIAADVTALKRPARPAPEQTILGLFNKKK